MADGRVDKSSAPDESNRSHPPSINNPEGLEFQNTPGPHDIADTEAQRRPPQGVPPSSTGSRVK